MRSFLTVFTVLFLGFALASGRANSSEETKSMNVKRITPVLLVKEIEPVVPFWVERLGFAKTIEVPDGNKLGFVTFQKGTGVGLVHHFGSAFRKQTRFCDFSERHCRSDVPNLRQRGEGRTERSFRDRAQRSHLSLHGSRQPGRRARRHERRQNRHARSNRFLRHEGIQRPGSQRALHHFRASGHRATALARRAKPSQTRPSTVAQYLSSYH